GSTSDVSGFGVVTGTEYFGMGLVLAALLNLRACAARSTIAAFWNQSSPKNRSCTWPLLKSNSRYIILQFRTNIYSCDFLLPPTPLAKRRSSVQVVARC